MATSAKKSKPAVTIVLLFVVTALFYGIMAISNTWYPRLGLDLRGGTTITLTASNTDGSSNVSSNSLELARQIIQQRVDSLGVGEAEVITQGEKHIVVSVPNVQKDELVKMVGQTAQLAFRIVYDNVPAGTTPSQDGDDTDQPGLPKPKVKVEPGKELSLDEKLAWMPSDADIAGFESYQCGDEVPELDSAALYACDENDGQKFLLGPIIVTGDHLKDSAAVVPQGQVMPEVSLQLTSEGGKIFNQVSGLLCKNDPRCTPGAAGTPPTLFAVVLDGRVMEAAGVRSANLGERIAISGNFTIESANQLANVLKYGALPLTFEISEVQNISATLGGDQLRGGLIAGLIGLILVIGYCFLYYQGLGVVVVGSLGVAALMTYGSMVLLGQAVGFTLNLPAIAGAIISIGLTADSFVIFFERIRDEIREGRSLRTAIETGWAKARSTIVVSDMVSILSAVVLFILAIGSVKGFAFTLGLTTIIDLAVVFFFTKPLLSLLGRTKFYGEGSRWSGFSAEHMGVSRESLLGRRVRRDTSRRVKQA